MVKPSNDINNVPNGAKLIKFLVALLIMYFIPSKLNIFSTAISVGSSSFVLIFTVLYVACISNPDNIALKIIRPKVKRIRVVVGWK